MTFLENIFYWSQIISPNNSSGSWISGELWRLDNGYLAIKKTNGQWLSINPQGDYTEAPEPRGVWEYFTLSSNLNVVTVTPGVITYAIYVKQQ